MLKKLAVLTIVATLGLSLLAAAPAHAAVVVKMTNSSFKPATKSVHKGTRVVWRNGSGRIHDVTSTSSNWSKSSNVSIGGSTAYTFGENGTFRYRCTRHGGMNGKIIVG